MNRHPVYDVLIKIVPQSNCAKQKKEKFFVDYLYNIHSRKYPLKDICIHLNTQM